MFVCLKKTGTHKKIQRILGKDGAPLSSKSVKAETHQIEQSTRPNIPRIPKEDLSDPLNGDVANVQRSLSLFHSSTTDEVKLLPIRFQIRKTASNNFVRQSFA